MSWIFGLIERFFIAVIAIVFTQVPSFVLQYTLLLKGHLQEIRRTLKILTDDLAGNQSSLSQLLQKLTESPDKDLQSQAKIWNILVGREAFLGEAYTKITEAPFYMKPLYLFGYFNKEMAEETWESFVPAIAFDLETLLFALIGVIIGSLFFYLLKLPFKRKRKKQELKKVP